MVRIDPDTLYSRGDLAEVLAPLGINPDSFVARIKPRKVFRSAFLGSDLLEAIRRADPLGADHPIPPARSRGGRRPEKKAVGSFTLEELGL